MGIEKKTTTMHLYPADYKAVSELAVKRGISIPEAARIIIYTFRRIVGVNQCIQLASSYFQDINKSLKEERDERK